MAVRPYSIIVHAGFALSILEGEQTEKTLN